MSWAAAERFNTLAQLAQTHATAGGRSGAASGRSRRVSSMWTCGTLARRYCSGSTTPDTTVIPRRSVNHHAGAVTAHGLGREGHASAVGWHHGLDNHGHTWSASASPRRWRRPALAPTTRTPSRPESPARGRCLVRPETSHTRQQTTRWRCPPPPQKNAPPRPLALAYTAPARCAGLAHRRRWCASENCGSFRGRRGGQVQLAHIRRQSRRGQHTAWRHGQPGLEQTSQSLLSHL